MNDLRLYVITLERAPERRAFMRTQLSRAGLGEPVWVPGIDWQAPDYAPRGGLQIQRDDVLIEHNWDGRKYVRGEDAIFQSHLRALETFLDSGARFGLMFEDDAELAPDCAAAIARTLDCAGRWDLVCLEGFRTWGGRPAIHVATAGDYDLIASLNPCAGSAAYLVNQRAARTLIAQAAGVFEPFDNYLNATWRHRLRLLDLAPFPVRQVSSLGMFQSMRLETHARRRRTPQRAFLDWCRHIDADFIRRYLWRWRFQAAQFGMARPTVARWARDWRA